MSLTSEGAAATAVSVTFRAHSICLDCYAKKDPRVAARIEELKASEPGGPPENCCYCGAANRHGTYWRGDNTPGCNCEPRFRNDCEVCVFLGRDGEHDLYFCEVSPIMPTVLARFSDEPEDYTSGLALANFVPPLGVALERARAKGLI